MTQLNDAIWTIINIAYEDFPGMRDSMIRLAGSAGASANDARDGGDFSPITHDADEETTHRSPHQRRIVRSSPILNNLSLSPTQSSLPHLHHHLLEIYSSYVIA